MDPPCQRLPQTTVCGHGKRHKAMHNADAHAGLSEQKQHENWVYGNHCIRGTTTLPPARQNDTKYLTLINFCIGHCQMMACSTFKWYRILLLLWFLWQLQLRLSCGWDLRHHHIFLSSLCTADTNRTRYDTYRYGTHQESWIFWLLDTTTPRRHILCDHNIRLPVRIYKAVFEYLHSTELYQATYRNIENNRWIGSCPETISMGNENFKNVSPLRPPSWQYGGRNGLTFLIFPFPIEIVSGTSSNLAPIEVASLKYYIVYVALILFFARAATLFACALLFKVKFTVLRQTWSKRKLGEVNQNGSYTRSLDGLWIS